MLNWYEPLHHSFFHHAVLTMNETLIIIRMDKNALHSVILTQNARRFFKIGWIIMNFRRLKKFAFKK